MKLSPKILLMLYILTPKCHLPMKKKKKEKEHLVKAKSKRNT